LIDPRNNSTHRRQWFGSVSYKNRQIASESTINSNGHTDYSQRGRCEVYTHADTMCAGRMFKLIETMGQLHYIIGFHPDFPSIKDIRIRP